MIRLWIILWFFFFSISCDQKPKNSPLLTNIFQSLHEELPDVVENPKRHQIQILYTQIDRRKDQFPKFTFHSFQLDTTQYFYPASTVKFPAAVLALDKLASYEKLGITKNTRLVIGTGYSGMTPVTNDFSSKSGNASVGQFIKKILVASDDDAFNRLYEFLGHKFFNDRMWELGYPDIRIRHRLSIFLTEDENRHTNPFQFYDSKGKILLNQPMARSDLELPVNSDENYLGNAHISKSKYVDQPMDFSQKNFYHLAEQQRFLRQFMFPETVQLGNQLNLNQSDYNFLYKWMSTLPRESQYPTYDDYESYPDGYCKFFIFGDSSTKMPKNIKIFNKVGWAYGFLIDNAYILDSLNGVEFFLSAVIYANSNETINDGIYDYDNIALPFLAKLGKAVYSHELERKRSIQPDLSRFIFNNK